MPRKRKSILDPSVAASNYRLAESEMQRRVDQFFDCGDDSSTSLRRELALARAMLEEAANSDAPGKTNVVKDLLSVIATLAKAHRAEQERSGELLPRAVIVHLARRVCEITADEFTDACADWEDRLDRVAEKTSAEIMSAHLFGSTSANTTAPQQLPPPPAG